MDHPFTRPRQDRLVAGVCAGIARRFAMEPWAVRLIAVALAIPFFWAAAIAYLALWLWLPEDESGRTGLQQLSEMVGGPKRGPGGVQDSFQADR